MTVHHEAFGPDYERASMLTAVNTRTGTLVFDPATLSQALSALEARISGQFELVSGDDADPMSTITQATYLTWHRSRASDVARLTHMLTEVSTDAAPLNSFLARHGFDPMFHEIPQGGLGAAAILDMLVEWAVPASVSRLSSLGTVYRAFEIPSSGIDVFTYPHSEELLVKLDTTDGGAVWLSMIDRPAMPAFDMLRFADSRMRNRDEVSQFRAQIKSVIIPTLEISQEADLSWMLGAHNGDHTIDQARQMVKLRMNEEGARVKAASILGTMRGISLAQPFVFDRPFMGWFTQPNSDIPIGIFWADRDSWKTPQGALADL